MLNLAEAARRLGITPQAVRKRIEKKGIPIIKQGRSSLISEADLKAIEGARGLKPTAAHSDDVLFYKAQLRRKDFENDELRAENTQLKIKLEEATKLRNLVANQLRKEVRAEIGRNQEMIDFHMAQIRSDNLLADPL